MAKKSSGGSGGAAYRAPKACNDTSGSSAPYGGGGKKGNYVPAGQARPQDVRQTPTQITPGGTQKSTDSAKSSRLSGGGKTVPKNITGKAGPKPPAMRPAGNGAGGPTMDVKSYSTGGSSRGKS